MHEVASTLVNLCSPVPCLLWMHYLRGSVGPIRLKVADIGDLSIWKVGSVLNFENRLFFNTYLKNYWSYKNGSPIKICRILQGKRLKYSIGNLGMYFDLNLLFIFFLFAFVYVITLLHPGCSNLRKLIYQLVVFKVSHATQQILITPITWPLLFLRLLQNLILKEPNREMKLKIVLCSNTVFEPTCADERCAHICSHVTESM